MDDHPGKYPDSGPEITESRADWNPTAEERIDMIEVAAYHLAERSGFRSSPHDCWAAAEEQIDLMFALRESKRKLQNLVESALDAVVMIDSGGIVTDWNCQAGKIFGWSRQEAVGQSIDRMIIPQRYRDAHVLGMKHFLDSGDGPYMNRMIEIQALHRDGHEFPVELAVAQLASGAKPEFSAFIRDITERERAASELREMATSDFLTGLANRRHFISRMSDELARMQRRDSLEAAVLMLDLDHFKRINDTYGHAIGDAMLKHFATLTQSELRKIDTAGRVGGEEFAILLPATAKREAKVFAERLRARIENNPLVENSQAISMTVSIGITGMKATDSSADASMIRADEALYRAKENGRNRVEMGKQ